MAIVTFRHFFSTFKITFQGNTATCFILTHKENQYIITAKHVFGNPVDGEYKEFEIQGEEISNKIFLPIIVSDKISLDIVAFRLPNLVIDTYDFTLSSSLVIGGDVIFLGFPYNLSQKVRNSKFNMALVKKAIISGLYLDENGVRSYYLDGHNNPGFSGGMVSQYDEQLKKHFIFAVISGYISQSGSNGYTENSGIIVAHDIGHIYERLDKDSL